MIPLWWLSYADDSGFKGAVMVEANNLVSACIASRIMHLSPGGQVRGVEFPGDAATMVPDHWKNRLLSKEDVSRFDREMWEKEFPSQPFRSPGERGGKS